MLHGRVDLRFTRRIVYFGTATYAFPFSYITEAFRRLAFIGKGVGYLIDDEFGTDGGFIDNGFGYIFCGSEG